MHNYVILDAAHNAFWELWSRRALFANSCVVFSTQGSDSSIVYALIRPESPEIMEKPDKISHILKEDYSPSFFQNSCPGNRHQDERDGVEITAQEESRPKNENEIEGWTKSLRYLPSINDIIIDKHLIEGSSTIPKTSTGPKAHRNKKHGYRLWKEGYVRSIFVKPNVKAECMLFLVKAKVHASMKNVQYTVYAHLNQLDGDVMEAKCNCKAGQGGCCKHVSALLFTLLDYSNMDAKEIPSDLTCTQVAQKWHVPSSANMTLTKAVKFSDVLFEKAEDGKKRKRPIVSGERNFCAIPTFAYHVKREEIRCFSNDLKTAGKAALFCSALESNDYEPCAHFETSCSRETAKNAVDASGASTDKQEQETIIQAVFKNMKDCVGFKNQEKQPIIDLVGVSTEDAIEICLKTSDQAENISWYQERSKRITASLFGKVMNRRHSVHPTSIIKAVLEKCGRKPTNMPAPLKWGIENEHAAIEEYKKYQDFTSCDIQVCGFVVNPKWPWLGCSPDGIVVENGSVVGCIEVKCPYTKRNFTIKEAADNDKNFFLKLSDGKCKLKNNHAYYFQCQGVMNILELPWIDFIVFTTRDMFVERIHRDLVQWESSMLPTLTNFFCDFILPELAN